MSKRKAIATFVGACTGLALLLIVFTAPPAFASTTITITKTVCSGGGTKYCYSPEDVSVTAGAPIEWVNEDTVSHNVAVCPSSSICPGAAAFHTSWACGTEKVALNGGTASCTLTVNGTYVYYCSLHGYNAMHGTITVTGGSSPTPTPTARPTPTPTARPTPTPSHSSGPTPTASGPTPPGQTPGGTATSAPAGSSTSTPTAAVATAPGQTPGDTPSGSASASASPTATNGQTSVGTTPTGTGGGSGFPIVLVLIVVVVVIAGGGGAAVLIRRRSSA
jgi:plastocyanin